MTGFISKKSMAEARMESPSRGVSDEIEINRFAQLNEEWISLRDRVLDQIVEDVKAGDLTAIEELLLYCDETAMKQYLPELDALP
jgi:hypothetical protein